MTSIAAAFADIAEQIDGRAQEETLREVFARTQTLCQEAVARASSADMRQLLGNVQAALARWHEVWPRLGGQRDFRSAVAREARLWSRKFSAGQAS